MDSGTASFGVLCLLSGAMLVLILLVFGRLMGWPSTRGAIAPRWRGSPPPFPLGWALQAWQDRSKTQRLDLDAEMMIRFCKLCLKCSSLGTLVSIFLAPMFFVNGGSVDAMDSMRGIERFSLAHVHVRARFVAVVAAAYLVVCVFMHFAIVEWRCFTALKQEHALRKARGDDGINAAQAQRSLLVELVPARAQSVDAVLQVFGTLFWQHGVHSVVLGAEARAPAHERRLLMQSADREIGQLREALNARVAQQGRADVARAPPECSPETAPLNAGAGACSRGDAAAGHPESGGPRLQIAREIRNGLLCHGSLDRSTAFVTLRSAADRVVAEGRLLSYSEGWFFSAAPEPRDIIWGNVAVRLPHQHVRQSVAKAALVAGLLCWSAPAIAAQAWADRNEALLCCKYLPILALVALLHILPSVIERLATGYERCKVKSAVQRAVMGRYLYFQLAALHITVFGGSVWGHGQQIASNPADVLQIAAAQVSGAALCLASFVVVRTCVTLPLLLVQYRALLGAARPGRGGGATAEPHSRHAPAEVAAEAADVAVVFVLGSTYSLIMPIIMPVCLAYLSLAYLVYTWLFHHVYQPEFDGGGTLWYGMFNGTMHGLALGMALLAANLGAACGLASFEFVAMVLLVAAILTFRRFCDQAYAVPSLCMAFEDAVAVDQAGDESVVMSFCKDCYLDPRQRKHQLNDN